MPSHITCSVSGLPIRSGDACYGAVVTDPKINTIGTPANLFEPAKLFVPFQIPEPEGEHVPTTEDPLRYWASAEILPPFSKTGWKYRDEKPLVTNLTRALIVRADVWKHLLSLDAHLSRDHLTIPFATTHKLVREAWDHEIAFARKSEASFRDHGKFLVVAWEEFALDMGCTIRNDLALNCPTGWSGHMYNADSFDAEPITEEDYVRLTAEYVHVYKVLFRAGISWTPSVQVWSPDEGSKFAEVYEGFARIARTIPESSWGHDDEEEEEESV